MATQLHMAMSPAFTDTSPPCQSPASPSPSQHSPVPVVVVSPHFEILQPQDNQSKRILKREDERQKLFDKVSNTVLDIPNGYREVHVLIIRWDESVDEFKGHDKEIERLRTIFVDEFRYGCSVEKISNCDDPQLALNLCVLNHVVKHQGENNLLIVYYTGHGTQVEDQKKGPRLRLSATRTWNDSMGGSRPVAYWDKAEKPLKRAKGDVLAILDCCFASTAALKDGEDDWRTYQLLAACAVRGNTSGPGKGSFTEALCDSLEQLLEQSKDGTFSVLKLEETINTKRAEKAALMWDRLKKHKRSVELGPLALKPQTNTTYQTKERASLTLRFSLTTDDLTNTQIDSLARSIPKVCKDICIGVRQVKWMGMEERDPHKMVRKVANELRRRVSQRKNSVSDTQRDSDTTETRKRPGSHEPLSPSAKRRAREGSTTSEKARDLGLRTPPGRAKTRSVTSDEEGRIGKDDLSEADAIYHREPFK